MSRKLANERIALRASLVNRDAVCNRLGVSKARTDKGGGSGRLGTNRHMGDRIVRVR